MNTKDIGEISEAQTLAAFLRAGLTVLLPFGDNQRYDLVVHLGNRFIRVQCKTGRLRDGKIVSVTRSSYAHRGRGNRGYLGEADFFAIYCPETDRVYIVPVTEKKNAQLRVEAPKNGQVKGIVWAKDVEFVGVENFLDYPRNTPTLPRPR